MCYNLTVWLIRVRKNCAGFHLAEGGHQPVWMVVKTLNVSLNEQQLKAICDALADTSRGLTKTELGRLLEQCSIEL